MYKTIINPFAHEVTKLSWDSYQSYQNNAT